MLKVTVEGIDGALDTILSITSSLDSKLQELCKRLADLGVDTARSWYEVGAEVGGQDEEPTVEVIPTANGCKIRAYGGTVFFLEFGAGVYAQSNEMNTEGLDTSPGSWSKDHLKQFTKKGYWTHKVGESIEKFYGVEPYSGMNQARATILQNIDIFAHEIFTGERGFR